MSRDSLVIVDRGLEERRSSTGRVRRTVRIDAEAMALDMDPKRLGRPVARGIADHLRQAVRNIQSTASPATLLSRKRAAEAFAAGKSWAMKRYAGGRIGAMAPNQSDRLFNDSGRFAQGITANASSDGAWRVNVAANRLDDRTAGSGGAQRIFERLVALVPEFQNIGLMFSNIAAIRDTVERVSRDRTWFFRSLKRSVSHFQLFAARHFGDEQEDRADLYGDL